MRTNKLRNLLKAGKPTLGTHLHSTWPSVVEAVGHTGLFDYVEFVAEYAPYDLYTLDNFCRTVELFDMSSMIKVDQANSTYVAQRAIGSGFQSVLFTDARSVEDARQYVSAVRADTPEAKGCYGVATRRMSYMGYGGSPDYVQALEDIVVVLMIEKKAAVDCLEEILAVEGIDMIQWGPADYSMSVGRPGGAKHPETKAVERHVIETCLRHGIPPRAEINSPDEAKYFLDMGVRHFCMATDLLVIHQWMKANGETLRKALEGA
jgi:4-hydroxy-2-oxoheptanedioate aldolase